MSLTRRRLFQRLATPDYSAQAEWIAARGREAGVMEYGEQGMAAGAAPVRIDSNDYSLDPSLVGRRVDVRVSQREVTAACLDSGEVACAHRRSFAKHRTITALEHARTLRQQRAARHEPEVELRPLTRYDALIPA